MEAVAAQPPSSSSTAADMTEPQPSSKRGQGRRKATPVEETTPKPARPEVQQRSPLFRLPRELRDRIYFELLHTQTPVRWPPNGLARTNLHPALIQTCRQAYVEATPLLYKTNVFEFSHPSDVSIFRAIFDHNNSASIARAVFRIRDQTFHRIWRSYFTVHGSNSGASSSQIMRNLHTNLPQLKALFVILECSWWVSRRSADENLAEWERDEALCELCSILDDKMSKMDTHLMCKLTIPRFHWDLLDRIAKEPESAGRLGPNTRIRPSSTVQSTGSGTTVDVLHLMHNFGKRRVMLDLMAPPEETDQTAGATNDV